MRSRDGRGVFLSDGRAVELPCSVCGVIFTAFTSQKRKFCGRRCYEVSKRSDDITCQVCGKVFSPRNKTGRYRIRATCSTACLYIHSSKVKIGSKNPHSHEWRRKVSDAQRGEKHHNWKGGTYATEERLIRHSPEYKEWRRHVFQRDDYTCQGCGIRGGRLEADHELPFALYPDLRLEILNGRTLCKPCHKKTPTYGRNGGALSPDSPMWTLAQPKG